MLEGQGTVQWMGSRAQPLGRAAETLASIVCYSLDSVILACLESLVGPILQQSRAIACFRPPPPPHPPITINRLASSYRLAGGKSAQMRAIDWDVNSL